MTWKQNYTVSDQSRRIRTVVAWLGFACFGATTVLPGTALLDLQIQMQESFPVASRIISLRAAGYFSGGLIFGIIEKYSDHNLLLAIACSIFGTSVMLIPLMYSWIFMGSCTFLMGMGQAGFDMVVHIYVLNLWKAKACNPIQIMQMCFGIGGLLAPVIVSPFLLPVQSEIGEVFGDDKNFENIHQFSPDQVHLHWAFFLFGLCTLGCALSFFSFYLKDKNDTYKSDKEKDEKEKQEEKLYTTSFAKETITVFISAAIAHFCVGCGSLICSFSQAYGVKSSLHMPKQSAALLSVAFWTSYVAGRTIFVLSTFFTKELKVMTFFLVFGSASIPFIFTARNEYDIFTFLTVFGFTNSPFFGLLISIPGQYFTPTGRQTSIIFLSGIVGEAIHPLIVSHYMDNQPRVFTMYLGTLAATTFVLMALLPIVCKKLFKLVESGSDKMPILADEEAIHSGSESDSYLSLKHHLQ